jgi:hypothetical protein
VPLLLQSDTEPLLLQPGGFEGPRPVEPARSGVGFRLREDMIRQTTRDEALGWLNDRIGKSVTLALSVDRGGWSIRPFAFIGVLKHLGEPGDGLAGAYTVGDDAGLNLSEIREDAFSIWEGAQHEELRIGVGEHAGIGIYARRD